MKPYAKYLYNATQFWILGILKLNQNNFSVIASINNKNQNIFEANSGWLWDPYKSYEAKLRKIEKLNL
jgi:hypothetical protein